MTIRAFIILLVCSTIFGGILLQFKDTAPIPVQESAPVSTLTPGVEDNCVVILTLYTDDTVGVEWC